MQIVKEFAKSQKVLYNLLEEEPDDSDYIDRTILCNMNEVADNFHTASYNIEQLDAYLSKRGSAEIIIIDSLPYFMTRFEEYTDFKKKWATKLAQLNNSEALEEMFGRLEVLDGASTEKVLLEKEIILQLDSQDAKKVKTATGKVYELVQLKSPRPHIELRKSKE